MKGHKNAILDLKWSLDSTRIYTAGADNFVFVWDTAELEKVKRLRGHEGVVNSLDVVLRGQELVK